MRVIAAVGRTADGEVQIRAWAAAHGHDIVAVMSDPGPWLTRSCQARAVGHACHPGARNAVAHHRGRRHPARMRLRPGQTVFTLDLPDDRQGGVLYAVVQKVVAHERELVRQQPVP